MRRKIIAGNWKMNLSYSEGEQLLTGLSSSNLKNNVEVHIAPPALYLKSYSDKFSFKFAAQNCSNHSSGAYTGEISTEMLKGCGINEVIIGHSERREIFHETDTIVNDKVKTALTSGLEVILCCGEPLDIREDGKEIDYVTHQITEALKDVINSQMSNVVIAYEPIWAIGTGKTASPDQAQSMHQSIRKHIAKLYSDHVAENTPILYGGSVKPNNAEELFKNEDIDGGLVGGASLKAKDFSEIINAI